MEKDKNIYIWIFIAIIVALFFIGIFGMGGYSMMGFGMGFGFIFMLPFWGLIIWFIVTLLTTSQSNKNEPDSQIILKRRYASGEITKKEYEEMRKELNK